MKKAMTRFGATIGLVGMLILGACGTEQETENVTAHQSMEPVEANLQVVETADVGAPVTLTVNVTQDGEAVDDADEIKFEVWKNDAKEDSEMLESSFDQNGTYTAETTFEEDGVYTVQVHVTARQMHTMPTTEVTVGNPAEAMDESEHHHTMSEITLDSKEATAGQAKMFMTHVMVEEEMLSDAEVQLEIFQDGADKHEWVKLEEIEAGMYKGEYTFDQTGTYNVQIHVTKGDDIHEHVMETVNVQ
ncbi:FixH family protein [Exiguobacterium algae]|uniref:FixH family protein n=1 Tax=Exiguobacterium algae TaxID=2751250 RepID=UPI001BEB59C6|nr:FixH family protein [Exiguobacterium algae]